MTDKSLKCRTLRVAKIALCAKAIPAMKVSRISTGRPQTLRSAANCAAWDAHEYQRAEHGFAGHLAGAPRIFPEAMFCDDQMEARPNQSGLQTK